MMKRNKSVPFISTELTHHDNRRERVDDEMSARLNGMSLNIEEMIFFSTSSKYLSNLLILCF